MVKHIVLNNINNGYAIDRVAQFSVSIAIKEYPPAPNDRVMHANHTKNSINNFMSSLK
jgi:hypothetical protein